MARKTLYALVLLGLAAIISVKEKSAISSAFAGTTNPKRDNFIRPNRTQTPGTRRIFRTQMVTSWYGWQFHGRPTASGTIYNMFSLTAAHRFLPFGTVITLTNPANRRTVTVTITDRGPYVPGRDLDISFSTAHRLGMVERGVVRLAAVVRLP